VLYGMKGAEREMTRGVADIRDSTVRAQRITPLNGCCLRIPILSDAAGRGRMSLNCRIIPARLTAVRSSMIAFGLLSANTAAHQSSWDGSLDSNSALALRKAAIASVGIAVVPNSNRRRPSLLCAGAHSSAIRERTPDHRLVRAMYQKVSFLVQWFKNECANPA
jgi:DNA-binding transcriptional LysR family regulator